MESCLLTHFTRKPVKGPLANSADPDQMPHNVASDQGLHCLLTGFSVENGIKAKNSPDTPKITNELVQNIMVEESTNIQWVTNNIIETETHNKLSQQDLFSLQIKLLLARLYESTESYCCHFDISVGVGITL